MIIVNYNRRKNALEDATLGVEAIKTLSHRVWPNFLEIVPSRDIGNASSDVTYPSSINMVSDEYMYSKVYLR